MIDVKCSWEVNALLGEGPVWCSREGCLYWVDIQRNKIHRYFPATDDKFSWTFEQQITSIAPRRDGGFIVTSRQQFALWDGVSNTLEYMEKVEPDLPDNRFNDGKVDARGHYWAGTMDDKQLQASGALYRLSGDMSVQTMDSHYVITNGPCFSPDDSILYHTDTVARTIYAFDKDRTGALANKRVFIQTPEAYGYPDGMTSDSEGCLWVCFYGGSRIVRYSNSGEELATIHLPVSNITSCTFGGDDYATLFITTASQGLDAQALKQQPLAGSLFACTPGVNGFAGGQFQA